MPRKRRGGKGNVQSFAVPALALLGSAVQERKSGEGLESDRLGKEDCRSGQGACAEEGKLAFAQVQDSEPNLEKAYDSLEISRQASIQYNCMRTFHSIAQALEELSREDELASRPWYGRVVAYCIKHSLADKTGGPLRHICFNPVIALAVVVVLYVVFLILFCPLWLLSFLITSYGSFLVFLILFHFLAVFITRSIAFPGSNTASQQQISADVMKRLSVFLEELAASANDCCALLTLVFTGQLPMAELQNVQRDLLGVWMSAQYLPSVFFGLGQAIEYASKERTLSPQEVLSAQQLMKGMEDFSVALQHLLNTITENDIAKLRDRSLMGKIGRDLTFRSQELASSAGKCLAASESLRVSSTLIRPKPTAEDDWDVLNLLKSLVWNSGVVGFDQLAFPFLRAQLQRTYGAKIIRVKGANDNGIDCLYINAAEAQRIRAARMAGTEPPASPSTATGELPPTSEKMVLFCGPNAGFFESIAQADYDVSWSGYYLSRGIDFFAFNYRGYGRSCGSPTPLALKQDVLKIYEYLMRVYKPKSLLVHGESIGGMVACHLAKTYPVQALFCDRTFGSLDATARRILAQLAGDAVKYLALWNTNVVDDYLAATCPKLIVQDPQDEIIAHASSLKCGIAARIVLGDRTLKIPHEPAEYAYARYLQAGLPNEKEAAFWLAQASEVNNPLPLQFIAHLYAACGAVAMKFEDNKLKTSADTNATSTLSSDPELGLISKGTASPTAPEARDGADANSLLPATSATSKSKAGEVAGGTENVIGEAANLRSLAARLQKTSLVSHPMQNSRVQNQARLFQLNLVDQVMMGGRPLGAYARAWFAISRIRGASGQLLNHALCRGLDELVAWVCSYIVWVPNTDVESAPSAAAAAAAVGTAARAVHDLTALADSVFPSELGADPALRFVIRAIESIEHRRKALWVHRQSSPKREEDGRAFVDGSASQPSRVDGLSWDASCCSHGNSAAQIAASCWDADLGDLVGFSCGHNGWPHTNELDQVTHWLATKTPMLNE